MGHILLQLGHGFIDCMTPLNLVILIVGLVLGLLIGVLPGLTLVMGVALALPFTYRMDVTARHTAHRHVRLRHLRRCLHRNPVRIPGEPIDVPLLWDGYPMARNGEPALALGWTLVAALGGGLFGDDHGPPHRPLAHFALNSRRPNISRSFCSVSPALSRSAAARCLTRSSPCRSASCSRPSAPTRPTALTFRFRFPILADGIEYLVVMVGAYEVGEVLARMETGSATKPMTRYPTRAPSCQPLRDAGGSRHVPALRILGFLTGVIPGAGATIASFVSYGLESQYGKRRRELGTGIAEGIVAPQSAATASVGGAMVPLLTMGIPGSGATAIIMAALMLQGVQPGPQVFFKSGDLVFAIFAAVFASVIGMCIIGYFAIKVLVKVLAFPEAITSAFVVMFCFIGAMASGQRRATCG